MERAGRLITQTRSTRKLLSREEMTLRVWPQAIGKRLMRKTRALKLAGDALVVEVEDEVLQRHLIPLSGAILKNLSKLMGAEAPARIEFRAGIPRRPPMRAEPLSAADDADHIEDPIMSYLYRQSRRKAGA